MPKHWYRIDVTGEKESADAILALRKAKLAPDGCSMVEDCFEQREEQLLYSNPKRAAKAANELVRLGYAFRFVLEGK